MNSTANQNLTEMLELGRNLKLMGCPDVIVHWGNAQLGKVCAKTVLQYAKGLLDVRKTLGIAGFDLNSWRDVTPELLMDIRKSYPELGLSASWEEKTWNAVRTFRAYLIDYKVRQDMLLADRNRQAALQAEKLQRQEQIRVLEAEVAQLKEEEQQIRLTYQRNRERTSITAGQLEALRQLQTSCPVSASN